MRILHTSDWHVGRTFHGTSTLDDLAAVLDTLAAVVHERAVDVVVIAGDVFDTATPSREAYSLLSSVLKRIRAAGAVVVLTSGNHDAAERLGAFAAFTAQAGVHICTRPEFLHEPVIIRDEHGDVHFFGIPYLEPALIRHRFPDVPLRSQEDAMRFALGRITDAMGEVGATRSVIVAHTFVSSGLRSVDDEVDAADAPRDFSRGGIDAVPLDLFDGVTYAALGHIHGRNTLAGNVRYSGAPLYYSFGDINKARGGWLVDLDADGLTHVEWVDLPVPRNLAVLKGTLSELLTDEAHTDAEACWVSATLTDATRPMDAMSRLRARFPYCVKLDFAPTHQHDDGHTSYAQRVAAAKTDEQIIGGFLERVRNGEGPTAAEQALIDDIVATQRAMEASR